MGLLPFILLIAPVAAAADLPPAKGVYTEDLNRGADPCTDLYEFANGSWRAQNPIPASMVRWSRRWQSGETAKDKLKEILEEASAQRTATRGSAERLIGDFYGSCMDQARGRPETQRLMIQGDPHPTGNTA